MAPGQRQTTLIPWVTKSAARAFDIPRTAALVTWYTNRLGAPMMSEAIEDMFRITPLPLFIICNLSSDKKLFVYFVFLATILLKQLKIKSKIVLNFSAKSSQSTNSNILLWWESRWNDLQITNLIRSPRYFGIHPYKFTTVPIKVWI